MSDQSVFEDLVGRRNRNDSTSRRDSIVLKVNDTREKIRLGQTATDRRFGRAERKLLTLTASQPFRPRRAAEQINLASVSNIDRTNFLNTIRCARHKKSKDRMRRAYLEQGDTLKAFGVRWP